MVDPHLSVFEARDSNDLMLTGPSKLAMVLGSSVNHDLDNASIVPMSDRTTARGRRMEMETPLPINSSTKPSPFILRLFEYPLVESLRRLHLSQAPGAHSTNYSSVMELHERIVRFTESIPSVYRFDNPDTLWDDQCPWLIGERTHLYSFTMLVLIALHRPFLFDMEKSRRNILLCGLSLLSAQQTDYGPVSSGQDYLSSAVYLTVEPSISMLAVIASHPQESPGLVTKALDSVEAAIGRLEAISDRNPTAGAGLGALRPLWNRVKAPRDAAATAATPGTPGRQTNGNNMRIQHTDPVSTGMHSATSSDTAGRVVDHASNIRENAVSGHEDVALPLTWEGSRWLDGFEFPSPLVEMMPRASYFQDSTVDFPTETHEPYTDGIHEDEAMLLFMGSGSHANATGEADNVW